MGYKVLIVDDEERGIEALKWKLSQSDYAEDLEITEFSNGKQALHYIKNKSYDLVFLDIKMPYMDGLEMAGYIKELKPYSSIIFVTGHDEYHLEALRLSAVDYIQKPINIKTLNSALHRFYSYRKSLVHTHAGDSKRIAIHLHDGITYVQKQEISYCSSESNYSYIHLTNNSKILTSKTLKYHENVLGNGFYRIHHQYLINLSQVIKYIKGSGGSIELIDGSILPVSRRKKDELLVLLGK